MEISEAMSEESQSAEDLASSIHPSDDSVTPVDLKVKLAEQQLLIQWKDGERSEFPLGVLRRQCPCATCRTERAREAANPLKILKYDPSTLHAVSARLAGNYGIQFSWSDGHDTGIFEFRFLRALDAKQ